MPYYWVRNTKGQVVAEVGDNGGLSVHDQVLSWQLQRLKEAGEAPFSPNDASEGRRWNPGTLLSFLEQNGYTVERQDR